MITFSTNNISYKSTVLSLISNNEPISYINIYKFLDECYSTHDIESVKKLVNYYEVFKLFICEDTYYTFCREIQTIMRKIALFNNNDIIDTIMDHANDPFNSNYKQQNAGCYIATFLYKYGFDTTAGELVNKYNLDKGEIIINMYKNSSDIEKIKYMILNNPWSIQTPDHRKWLLTYIARNDDINFIKYLKQYYTYTEDDIFTILFNFSKSYTGSTNLYIYIFNNYIDIIKNETFSMYNLIKELFYSEHYNLIYFILNKIEFNNSDLLNIFTFLFNYEPFFNEIIENITDIMLNCYKMNLNELKNIYYQLHNKNVNKYIEEHF
jgi:hypothetical protein